MSPVDSTCGPRQRSMKFAVLEVRDLFPFRDRLDDLDLVFFAARTKPLDRLGARDDVPLERQVLRDDLAHLLFDARGVLGRERLGVEVVIEAGLDRRTDRHLGAGSQPLDGVRHHVRGGVSHPRQRIVRNVPLVAGPNGLFGTHAYSIAARPDPAPDQTATKSSPPIEEGPASKAEVPPIEGRPPAFEGRRLPSFA